MKKIGLLTAVTLSACIGMSVTGKADTQYFVSGEDDLQQIIDTCNDSIYNRVEIYMESGTYSPFDAVSDMAEEPRYIDFIGMGMVVVESDDGRYESPAAKLRLDGKVEGISFVATHRKGEVPPDDDGAYAVHADYGSQHTEFKDCSFLSYQTASVGMGLTHDSEVTFENCQFTNRADESLKRWKDGAIYVHSDVHDFDKAGARLNFNSCSFVAPAGAHGNIITQELNGSSIEINYG
ncbi:hypothetical protein [Oribacterium sp. WCC10]|uniref:hypothetical protein n=1 Tax=Oribacterium sp. WCC10 TaxID=1855343 RepID=UPI0008ED4B1F|nr:hypothetical protein [Oribacterium sp. WCC10]SFG07053.1 hypothetical protein SAMN05216356_10192 [Oribacterium sp. WCC10]